MVYPIEDTKEKNWLQEYQHSQCEIVLAGELVLGRGLLVERDIVFTSKHVVVSALATGFDVKSVVISFCGSTNTCFIKSVIEDGAPEGHTPKIDYVMLRLGNSVSLQSKPVPLYRDQNSADVTSIVDSNTSGTNGMASSIQFHQIFTKNSLSGNRSARYSGSWLVDIGSTETALCVGWYTAFINSNSDTLPKGIVVFECVGQQKLLSNISEFASQQLSQQ